MVLGLGFKATKHALTTSLVITNIVIRTSYSMSQVLPIRRSRDLLPFKARVTIYKAYIRPLMEYASPIWSGASRTALGLLSRLQQMALRLFSINDPINAGIYPWEHRRDVATLSTFYRHFFFKPSLQLGTILLPELPTTRTKSLSTTAHPYCVISPMSRGHLHQSLYIPRAGWLWNSLSVQIFPEVTNIGTFKGT